MFVKNSNLGTFSMDLERQSSPMVVELLIHPLCYSKHDQQFSWAK